MSQFDAPATVRRSPGNNIYSMLVFIAFVSLAVACGFVWHKNVELTEGQFSFDANPFKVVQQPQG